MANKVSTLLLQPTGILQFLQITVKSFCQLLEEVKLLKSLLNAFVIPLEHDFPYVKKLCDRVLSITRDGPFDIRTSVFLFKSSLPCYSLIERITYADQGVALARTKTDFLTFFNASIQSGISHDFELFT